jgi:hypothetical protein
MILDAALMSVPSSENSASLSRPGMSCPSIKAAHCSGQ